MTEKRQSQPAAQGQSAAVQWPLAAVTSLLNYILPNSYKQEEELSDMQVAGERYRDSMEPPKACRAEAVAHAATKAKAIESMVLAARADAADNSLTTPGNDHFQWVSEIQSEEIGLEQLNGSKQRNQPML